MHIQTNKPKGFILFASCDSKYLEQHGKAFAISAARAGNDCHIHIIDPEYKSSKEAFELRNYISNVYGKQLTISSEYSLIRSKFNPEQARVYYACNRFLTAPILMEECEDVSSILVSDIDSLIMKRIEEPQYDLGLFLRDPLPGTVGWEREGTKVAAGIFFFNKKSYDFALRVKDLIWKNWSNGKIMWFLDQMCLNQAYQESKDFYENNFHCFTMEEMDWEFKDGTVIWTGKGPRKYDNPIYVSKKKEFDSENINTGT